MTAWDALAAQRAGIPVLAPGHVWLAGAGPGDPGLLTLDALAGLSQADVVVHDALVDPRVLALAGPQARLEFAGKRGGKPSATQADITRAPGRAGARRPARAAAQGRRSLRLRTRRRGGDGAGGRGRSLPRHPRRHRRAGGARRGVDPGDAARRQPRGDFRRRPRRRRGFRLGAARPRRPADRALHGDAQSRTDRRRIDGSGTPGADAGRHHRFGDHAETARSGLDAGKTFRRCARAEIRTAGDRRDRRDREFSRAAASARRHRPRTKKRSESDGARPHHRRAAFRRRQNHGDARAHGGAAAARARRARGESRTRLHRSGVPRRRHRFGERQSR